MIDVAFTIELLPITTFVLRTRHGTGPRGPSAAAGGPAQVGPFGPPALGPRSARSEHAKRPGATPYRSGGADCPGSRLRGVQRAPVHVGDPRIWSWRRLETMMGAAGTTPRHTLLAAPDRDAAESALRRLPQAMRHRL